MSWRRVLCMTLVVSVLVLVGGLVGARIPPSVDDSDSYVSANQSQRSVKFTSITRALYSMPQLDLNYSGFRNSVLQGGSNTSHYNTATHSQHFSETYSVGDFPGTYETYGYHNARDESGTVVAYDSSWSGELVIGGKRTISAADVEAQLAKEARAFFPELTEWEVYPLYERWRNGRFHAFDAFLAVAVEEWIQVGDWKPSIFVQDDAVAIVIQRQDNSHLMVAYVEDNEGMFQTKQVVTR